MPTYVLYVHFDLLDETTVSSTVYDLYVELDELLMVSAMQIIKITPKTR